VEDRFEVEGAWTKPGIERSEAIAVMKVAEFIKQLVSYRVCTPSKTFWFRGFLLDIGHCNLIMLVNSI
jgi:hypothetical protein